MGEGAEGLRAVEEGVEIEGDTGARAVSGIVGRAEGVDVAGCIGCFLEVMVVTVRVRLSWLYNCVCF